MTSNKTKKTMTAATPRSSVPSMALVQFANCIVRRRAGLCCVGTFPDPKRVE